MIKYTKKEKAELLKLYRESTRLTAKEFAQFHNIPYSTYTKWEEKVTEIPQYVLELIAISIKHFDLRRK